MFLGTVNFNHTFGCQKCTVRAKKSKEADRMYYPLYECPLRTDISFRERHHSLHHKQYSIMELLPIDMVNQFITSDPLHLIELGIVKK